MKLSVAAFRGPGLGEDAGEARAGRRRRRRTDSAWLWRFCRGLDVIGNRLGLRLFAEDRSGDARNRGRNIDLHVERAEVLGHPPPTLHVDEDLLQVARFDAGLAFRPGLEQSLAQALELLMLWMQGLEIDKGEATGA